MFKAGDKVRIKSDLKINKDYNGCYFTSQMEVHKGKIGTIVSVHYDNYQTRRYELDIDNMYYFSNDMLDPILPYKVGDMVRIVDEKPEYHYGISDNTWLKLLGKSGRIIKIDGNSHLISILETPMTFWFPLNCFEKESILTSENSIKNVSKPIESVPEIKLSYCKKQIYTI